MHTVPRRIGSALLVPLLLLSTLGSGAASTTSPGSGPIPDPGASEGWDVGPADSPQDGAHPGRALPEAGTRIGPLPSLPLPDDGPGRGARRLDAAATAAARSGGPGCGGPPAKALLLARRAVHARLLLARSGLLSSPATAPPGAGPLPLD